ncbi:MAG: YraN family protein [Bdellovibrionota bacterium]
MRELPRVLGARAEREAEKWFATRAGAKLLARNYFCKGGEIDLVFEEKRESGRTELVFVEVRSRGDTSWVSAAESVGTGKKMRLSRAIRHFLARYHGPASGLRVDLMAQNGTSWEHLPNIRMD